KQNRNEAALDEMRRASELAPEDAEIRNNLGLALARLGRIPEAINEFHEAVRLEPNNAAAAHANLGWALLESGKPRESIPEFEAALQLNPEFKAAADGLRQAQAQLSPQREFVNRAPMTARIQNFEQGIQLCWWIILAVVIAVVVFIRIHLLAIPLERDEGEYAYAGQLMLEGIPPYRLAYNMKFPGVYAAYALIMWIFGQTSTGIHLGLLIVNIANIVIVF